MAQDFRQFIHAEIQTMVRDIGKESMGDVDKENTRAIEWIQKNAVRFRDEWVRIHRQAEAQ
jgi:hypothetical protein